MLKREKKKRPNKMKLVIHRIDVQENESYIFKLFNNTVQK